MIGKDPIPLQNIIKLLESLTKVQICVRDLSGVLRNKNLRLSHVHTIHSKLFCSIAKSTPEGMRRCVYCRNAASEAALRNGGIIYGHCLYGLYEICLPVYDEEKPLCIISIGNMVTDPEYTKKRIRAACAGKVNDEAMFMLQLGQTCPVSDPEPYAQMAWMLASYIKMLYNDAQSRRKTDERGYHWAVTALKVYIDSNFSEEINFKNAAKNNMITDKYVGRLFKKQIGRSFHEYLNDRRMEHAGRLLRTTDKSVTEISFECGFNSVPYFNRVFRAKYKTTPGQYRIDGINP